MKYKLTTTLNLLREHSACESSYRKLVKSLGKDWPKDKPINLLAILESNGVEDMCWCFRATTEDSTIPRALCAADFGESVLHIWTAKSPLDNRPAKVIQAARDFATGKIGDSAAYSYSYAAAADDATYAYAAAYTAVYAAARAAATSNDAHAARTKQEKKNATIIRSHLK